MGQACVVEKKVSRVCPSFKISCKIKRPSPNFRANSTESANLVRKPSFNTSRSMTRSRLCFLFLSKGAKSSMVLITPSTLTLTKPSAFNFCKRSCWVPFCISTKGASKINLVPSGRSKMACKISSMDWLEIGLPHFGQ